MLTLRATREMVERFGSWHLVFGLLVTMLVGVGRSWDDSKASLLRQTGVGSLVYVLVFAIAMSLIVMPMTRQGGILPRLLIAAALTSPPGLLYAFPIEKLVSADSQVPVIYNSSALMIVSIWRVAMMARILRSGLGLTTFATFASILAYIGGALFVFGLSGMLATVANSMGGYRERAMTVGEQIAAVAFQVSVPICIVGFLVWLWAACQPKSE